MTDTNLEELRELSRRLHNLLSDPHPGLFTWQNALRRVVEQIARFGGFE